MGFYLEMRPRPEDESEFREDKAPPVFWFLYLVLGFALGCMGAAAFTVMRDLISQGSALDLALAGFFVVAVVVYVLLGVKLVAVRKFVRLGEALEVGYRLLGRPVLVRRIEKKQIDSVDIINRRPSPNVARYQHDDPRYQIQGHWAVSVKGKSGQRVSVDRSTDRGALEDLFASLQEWCRA